MDEREKENRQAEISWIIGRLGICAGYDELTRLELEAELRELIEEVV